MLHVGIAQRHRSRPDALDQLCSRILINHLDIDHIEHNIGVRCYRHILATHVRNATTDGYGPVESTVHSVLHIWHFHKRSNQSHPKIMRTANVSVQLAAVQPGGDERVPGVFGQSDHYTANDARNQRPALAAEDQLKLGRQTRHVLSDQFVGGLQQRFQRVG